MSCRSVQARLSPYLDGELAAAEGRAVAAHLESCGHCRERWRALRNALDRLGALPRLDPGETIASRVRDRLELERRGPGLALLFRTRRAARPFMLPSLLPALVVLVGVVGGALMLGAPEDPSLPPVASRAAWERASPALGTEANPYFPSSDVAVPRARGREDTAALLEAMGEGTLFLETVVARDGSVSAVYVLAGDSEQAKPFLEALRRERFEPARYRGRPVAVSVYRLISRMDVRAPIT